MLHDLLAAPPTRWRTDWSTDGESPSGHWDWVVAMATAEVDGRLVALSGGSDQAVRAWDAATGEALGEAVTGHWGTALATMTLQGRPLVLSSGTDMTVRVWDLAAGRPSGEPLRGFEDKVEAVATTVVDGRPVAVTATGSALGLADPAVRIWDLTTRRPIGAPLTGHADAVCAVTTTTLHGRAVAVTAGNDATVRIWDLATQSQLGAALTGHTDAIWAIATTVLDGRAVAVTSSDDSTLRVWDLAAGAPLGTPLTGHTAGVETVTTTVLDGRPVAVSGSWDQTVRIWDLATGAQVGPELAFPAQVQALTATPDGRLLVGYDRGVAALSAMDAVKD
ncbi:WD-40 repeat protein [Catenulispora acidiphila DSM 44928]|uniref:WD-40 repeat protein n=1 Tax=Catenulispora acidiphila (strain DSM 44928 / JCM 14897 / NBRC 102108 / NRRL B-24433 / ID139908) TaxID=479433 RepID=C7QEZ8_CATAD|nr:WD40 repeat domain-containing protein [Catenulispora acidiphila]ACU74756.1 WD-40 repeat protein [Catenulispora acidiphila DSM 44928]